MFPEVGDTTKGEVVSSTGKHAHVMLDCGYIAFLPGRGYLEGDIVDVRVVSKTESRGNQPSITVEEV